ncbi:MAG: hypothetical protein AABM29_11150 [Actinomycetota bacterium]
MVPIAGVVLDRSAAAFGLMAAGIAVGGFVAGGQAILRGWDEKRIRLATVRGGFGGLLVAPTLMVIDALAA